MVALDWKKATLPVISMIRPSWLKKLPTVASYLLLVGIALSFAKLTWLVLPAVDQRSYKDPSPLAGAVGDVAVSVGTANLPDVSRWHLFGKAGAVVIAPPRQEEVPETKLRLELKGILASSDPKLARAIVSEPPRSEDTYAVGAALPGGVTLDEIQKDHIVLLRGGQREKLLLPRESMQSVATTGQAAPVGSSVRGAITPERPSFEPASSSGGLSMLRHAINNDPQSLMGLINAKPEIVDGKIAGFKLDNVQNDQMLRRFGLRRGDVVTAVNDIRLDGAANLPELLNILKTAEQVKIEYTRRGRPRSVVLNMDE